MYGKTLWQWLKPMLLMLPVFAVTAMTLLDLTASATQAARPAMFNRVQLVPVTEEALPADVVPSSVAQTATPVPEGAERAAEVLGTQVRAEMSAVALSWAELVGDDGSRAGDVALGDSFQSVTVQAVVLPVGEPAGDTATTAQPPSATQANSGAGTTPSSPQTTTGGDDHGGNSGNSGSGNNNSGSGNGNSGSGGGSNSGSGNSGSGGGNSRSGHGGNG